MDRSSQLVEVGKVEVRSVGDEKPEKQVFHSYFNFSHTSSNLITKTVEPQLFSLLRGSFAINYVDRRRTRHEVAYTEETTPRA